MADKKCYRKYGEGAKNLQEQTGKEGPRSKKEAYFGLINEDMFNVRSFTVQLKDKEVPAMKPIKDIAHENVLENLEPEVKRRKLTESALMALISDKHSIQLDKSTGIYFLKLKEPKLKA